MNEFITKHCKWHGQVMARANFRQTLDKDEWGVTYNCPKCWQDLQKKEQKKKEHKKFLKELFNENK